MKAALYYAFRELKHKPKEFISLIAVSSAVLAVITLYLIYGESKWLETYSTDRPENYHIQLFDLTLSEAEQIAGKPYVMSVYPADSSGSHSEYHIRLYSKYNMKPLKYAIMLCDEYELWKRPYYSSLDREAVIYNNPGIVLNRSYTVAVGTPYIAMPATVIIISLFALFLGMSIALLQNEHYRRNFAEYGSLRAFGLKKSGLYFINIIETLCVQILSFLPAFVFCTVFIKLFGHFTRNIVSPDSVIFNDLFSKIPIDYVSIVFILLTIAASAGSVLVCRINEKAEIMDLLSGRRAYSVSFVSKTSDKFEKARTTGVYSRLRLTRSRKTVFISSLELAIMLPLPTLFAVSAYEMRRSSDSDMQTAFLISLAAMLILCAVCVAFTVSCYHIFGRRREFAIFRSLGLRKIRVLGIALPAAAADAAMSTLAGSLVTAYFYYEILYAEKPFFMDRAPLPIIGILLYMFIFTLLCSCMTVPVESLGTTVSTLSSLTDNISQDLREVE